MAKRHEKTLAAVFAEPIRANIHWRDIEALLVAIGCTVREGGGSVVVFKLGRERLVAHRPHPRREAGKNLVGSVREFLIAVGVRP